ncbi:hypothetical protein KJZ61_01710 [Candidatus Dependentiae bacterium]|nr:hypothetical protein [Candidatus Dependentiae bacterium]
MKTSIFFLMLLLYAINIQGCFKSHEFDQKEIAPYLFRIRFVSSEAMMATLRNSESMLNRMISCCRGRRDIVQFHGELFSIVFNTNGKTSSAVAQLLLQHDESIQKITIKKWELLCKKR